MTAVTLRPLERADRDLIADAFEQLSPRSRYLRFLSPMPRLPRRTLDALAAVDGTDHIAWVALAGGRAAGIARCVRDPHDPRSAEFAIAVVDSHQGKGVGRRLMAALLASAAAAGIERVTFDMHPENTAALALVRSLGADPVVRDGLLAGEIRPAPAPRPCGSSARRRRALPRPLLGTRA